MNTEVQNVFFFEETLGLKNSEDASVILRHSLFNYSKHHLLLEGLLDSFPVDYVNGCLMFVIKAYFLDELNRVIEKSVQRGHDVFLREFFSLLQVIVRLHILPGKSYLNN